MVKVTHYPDTLALVFFIELTADDSSIFSST